MLDIYKVLRELEESTSDWRSKETVESYGTSMPSLIV
jgi:hypothetical protein